ncbi:DUF4913 domain-containing protein [Streptomyces sp. HUAS TT7]|uniref:DUF4913 domain-containing protein n=1 Tax=Streptomyces sp. HUAS TT7 TaxID=3447507 RepID=UPI003F65BE0B
MSEETPSLDGLSEDLEDLRAIVTGFASQLEHNTNVITQLATNGGQAQDGEPKEKEKEKEEEKPKTPPFILRLSNPEFARELAALDVWVRTVLVPTYLDEVSSAAPWCPTWWEHDGAYARLHACWLAWQALTDPAVCGHTGPSVWHRDHLDPMLSQLRSPSGPFAGCMTNPDRVRHSIPAAPPVVAVPYVPPPADSTTVI